MILGLPESGVEITGTVQTYVDHGTSGGEVHRQFCPTCGSPVFTRVPAQVGGIFVKAGSLRRYLVVQPADPVLDRQQAALDRDPGRAGRAGEPGLGARQPGQRLIQRLEEARAVSLGEGCGTADRFASGAPDRP